MKNLLAALILVVLAFSARADVTFDPSTGQGFIGRGDVISYLGKAGLVQSPTVVFISGEKQVFEVTWQWETGKQEVKTHSLTKKIELTSTLPVTVTTRTANGKLATHITGYLLSSAVATTIGEALPVIGETQHDASGNKVCVSVELVSAVGLNESGLGELWFYTDALMTSGSKMAFTVPVAADEAGDL
jgi:hypothetical protein